MVHDSTALAGRGKKMKNKKEASRWGTCMMVRELKQTFENEADLIIG